MSKFHKMKSKSRNTYSMGIKNSWWKTSEHVRKREKGKCFYCGAPATEVHHIIPLSRGGTNSNLNMVLVCHRCHALRHRHLR